MIRIKIGAYTLEEWLHYFTRVRSCQLIIFRVPPDYNLKKTEGWYCRGYQIKSSLFYFCLPQKEEEENKPQTGDNEGKEKEADSSRNDSKDKERKDEVFVSGNSDGSTPEKEGDREENARQNPVQKPEQTPEQNPEQSVGQVETPKEMEAKNKREDPEGLITPRNQSGDWSPKNNLNQKNTDQGFKLSPKVNPGELNSDQEREIKGEISSPINNDFNLGNKHGLKLNQGRETKLVSSQEQLKRRAKDMVGKKEK